MKGIIRQTKRHPRSYRLSVSTNSKLRLVGLEGTASASSATTREATASKAATTTVRIDREATYAI